jgi:hypothetical protein
MKFDDHSADALRQTHLGQIDLVVNNAGIPKMVPLTPEHKRRPAPGRVAPILAFAAGLLVAALGAEAADEPTRSRPTAERAGTDSVRVPPTARQLAPPSQPDVSASDARYVDELYRQLIGPPPVTSLGSRLRAAPSDDAAGGVRRWMSPR